MFTKIIPPLFKTLPVFALLAVSLFISSCNPQRKVFRSPLKEEGADYLFSKLKENELKFDLFAAKFSAEYSNNKTKNSFNGQIRIARDSIIWLSFSPMLGIEVFRMLITQDSVKFINRMNNTYFSGDYGYVNKFLNTNIDFDILQAFLLGNDLSFYEDGKFKASIEKMNYKLSTAGRQKLKKYVRNSQETLRMLIQNIFIDPGSFKIVKADVKEISDPNIKLEATYEKFEKIDNQLFPKEMEFNITADNAIRVNVNFIRININHEQQFPFRIPLSYRKVE
jgi:hypothetical protein